MGNLEESEGESWLIGGIAIMAPLKPISTVKVGDACLEYEEAGVSSPATPTARESRLPEILTCPPPPRKRRFNPVPACRSSEVIEFFNPPDLESVFVCR